MGCYCEQVFTTLSLISLSHMLCDWCAGTGDNAASALGNGAVSSGTLVCSLGTSGT